mgnify:CR=1 FL=1
MLKSFEFEVEGTQDDTEDSGTVSIQSPSKSTPGIELIQMLEMLTSTKKKN